MKFKGLVPSTPILPWPATNTGNQMPAGQCRFPGCVLPEHQGGHRHA